MINLQIKTPSASYPIVIGGGALAQLAREIERLSPSQVIVVTNATVWQAQGKRFKEALGEMAHIRYELPEGEGAKSLTEIEKLCTYLIEQKADRKSLIVAFGGGVVGDAAGFAAATFMRGIRFIQVPTTLLSQVDSSVGGKVGINHPLGKNLIGAFYHPEAVIIDTETLASLPERELRCGLGEVVKYGYIRDAHFLAELKSALPKLLALDADATIWAINRCLEIKRDVVNLDEREAGLRAILNFGHSFGHALEAFHSFEGIKHGEAVLAGMIPALSLSKGSFNLEEERAFLESIFAYKNAKASADALIELMRSDKKNIGENINIITLKNLGEAELRQASEAELRSAWGVLL